MGSTNNISRLNVSPEKKYKTNDILTKGITRVDKIWRNKNIKTCYKKNVLVCAIHVSITGVCDRIQKSTELQRSECTLLEMFLSTCNYTGKPELKGPKRVWVAISLPIYRLLECPLVYTLAQSSGVTHKFHLWSGVNWDPIDIHCIDTHRVCNRLSSLKKTRGLISDNKTILAQLSKYLKIQPSSFPLWTLELDKSRNRL